MLTLDKVYHAGFVLKDVIRKTDLIHAPKINSESDIYLKTENLQITGSFKVRGAYYKISQLSDEEKSKGVIACSAGNHAQGVALAAAKNGIKSLICLPDGAPISKVEATKGYGAEVCLVEGVYDDAYNKAIQLRDEKGYTFIHPFDDENVIAGQGTIGLELLEQLPDADAVIVPVGGGGLISGVAFAIKQLRPEIKIYGVQASGAPSMVESLQNGKSSVLIIFIFGGIPNRVKIFRCYICNLATVFNHLINVVIVFSKKYFSSSCNKDKFFRILQAWSIPTNLLISEWYVTNIYFSIFLNASDK